MKKILIIFSLLAVSALTGCENFLDSKNLMKKDTSNYPANEAEVQELLTGTYRMAREAEIAPTMARNGFLISLMMSDDCFAAAGGTSDNDIFLAKFEKFQWMEENAFQSIWDNCYRTIFRANTMIEGLSLVKWENQATRNNAEAQGLFLRAYVFSYLARMFGTAPMPLASEPVNLPRASADEMYGQIAADLVKAIGLFPSTPRFGADADKGRATKWAAQALLARVFLFYTGYYGKSEIVMAGEAGTLTKSQVIAYLDDCIANSGHDLLPSFYSLWPYSNKFSRSTREYKWMESVDPEKKIEWAGEEGANVETLFSWQFGAAGGTYEGNLVNLFVGMRMLDYSSESDTQTDRTYPYGSGWGFCTVNTKLWESYASNDPRRAGSIININDPLEATGYVPGADSWLMETGYYLKKYMPIVAQDDEVGTVTGVKKGRVNISKFMYPTQAGNGYNNNNHQDLVIIRFADVLLMAAELKEDVSLINRVRARVGLDPVAAYSLEALQNERRWELAFEGYRWYDMLRWGMDYAAAAMNAQNGVSITNSSGARGEVIEKTTVDLGDATVKLKATGGFFPIPMSEISKSGGVLVQTPGWTIGQ